jgi:hypothetical protein
MSRSPIDFSGASADACNLIDTVLRDCTNLQNTPYAGYRFVDLLPRMNAAERRYFGFQLEDFYADCESPPVRRRLMTALSNVDYDVMSSVLREGRCEKPRVVMAAIAYSLNDEREFRDELAPHFVDNCVCFGETLNMFFVYGSTITLEMKSEYMMDAFFDWLTLPRQTTRASLRYGTIQHAQAVLFANCSGVNKEYRRRFSRCIAPMKVMARWYLQRKLPPLLTVRHIGSLIGSMSTLILRRAFLSLSFAFGRWYESPLTTYLRWEIYLLAFDHFKYNVLLYEPVFREVERIIDAALARFRARKKVK